MGLRRQLFEYTTEKYGNFTIEDLPNKAIIWWDFYDEQDGSTITPGEEWFENYLKMVIKDGCDVKDFSDIPKKGEFRTAGEAKAYIEKKFGKID